MDGAMEKSSLWQTLRPPSRHTSVLSATAPSEWFGRRVESERVTNLPRQPGTTIPHIWDKLDRASYHIEELEGKIAAFVRDPQRTLINPDAKALKEFKKLYVGTKANPEFSIIAGEVFYQLYSSIDNLVCSLIEFDEHSPSTKSGFPIFVHKPADKNRLADYERYIQGITRRKVRAFIKRHQPYGRGKRKAPGHPLAILKTKCNLDKHRRLDIHVTRLQRTQTVKSGMFRIEASFPDRRARRFVSVGSMDMNVHRRFTPYVTFQEISNKKAVDLDVTEVLRQLHGYVVALVEDAEEYFS
jgi:hypothetical protein